MPLVKTICQRCINVSSRSSYREPGWDVVDEDNWAKKWVTCPQPLGSECDVREEALEGCPYRLEQLVLNQEAKSCP